MAYDKFFEYTRCEILMLVKNFHKTLYVFYILWTEVRSKLVIKVELMTLCQDASALGSRLLDQSQCAGSVSGDASFNIQSNNYISFPPFNTLSLHYIL